MLMRVRGLVLVALCLAVTPDRTSGQDATTVAFVNATVVDVERGVVVPRQTIITSRGRIEQVGSAASVRVPRGASRVDLAGRFVIPGLWDMHVHIADADADIDASVGYFGSLFLANGVTGVRDGGGDGARLASMDSIGRARPGSMPRLVYAREKVGPAEGETWTLSSARAAIDARMKAGADYIKLAPEYPVDLFTATLAHCATVRVACVAHVPAADTSVWLSVPGRGSYEHLFHLAEQVSRVPAAELFAANAEYQSPTLMQRVLYKLRLRRRPPDPPVARLAQRDPTRDQAFFARIASSGTWFTPTLILHNQIVPAVKLPPGADDSTMALYPVAWNPGRTPAHVDTTRLTWRLSAGLVRSMHAAGVRMLAGSDFTGRHVPGVVLHAELALLQEEGGVPAADVLRMATINPARYLGATDSLGTVAAGRVADLVVLRANPLDDIRNVGSVEMVMTQGYLLRRAALDTLASKARTALARMRGAASPARTGS